MNAVTFALAGAVGGLAWTASLRGYMAELAVHGSRVDWTGTFVQILLPGVVIGVLLGIAEHVRRIGGRRGWRWLAAAPILFGVATLSAPGALVTFVTTGIGGAALGVSVMGILGGFAVSGRGPLWGRIAAGLPALAIAVGGSVAPFFFEQRTLALPEPRGVWVALLFASLAVVFAFACSIPHRKVVALSLG